MSTSMSNAELDDPMDVDPVDGGPKPTPAAPTPAGTTVSTSFSLTPLWINSVSSSSSTNSSPNTSVTNLMAAKTTTEEEARQCIEKLRGENVSERVEAAHCLDQVASVLGQERTRRELIPFLAEGIDDEDEVLLAMAMSLGRMVEKVGGPSQAFILLRPLELLLSVEELAVRDAACVSAQNIANQMPDAMFESDFADMLTRLAKLEWFTARLSAARLMAAAFARLQTKEKQQEHLQLYCALCKDETPMVRRVAAQFLGKMLQSVFAVMGREACMGEGGIFASNFMPLYEEFASMEQPDSVRLQTSENCVAFGEVMSQIAETSPLTESETALLKRVLPLIVATIDDRSWRVRWTAAAKFALVIKAYYQLPDAIDILVPGYEKLLQDPEAEVRTAATFNLAHVAKCNAMVPVTPVNRLAQEAGDATETGSRITVAERLVKRVTSLTEDDSEHVRAALAMVATGLAPALGKDATITYLVPPVLLLLRDAASEVRLNLISSLGALNEVIGVDLLSQSLLPAILDLAQDGKWRIRLAIIEHIPLLAKQLGCEFFTEKLVALCLGWLGDEIATIRTAAAVNLKHLTALFGASWAIENMVPVIVEIRQHDSYLRRLTALQGLSMMATEMDKDTASLEILPLMLEMATDVVPNIRFNLAKELEKVAPACTIDAYRTQIVPILSILLEDDDRDVRYFAERSASSLKLKFAAVTDAS
ncbi:protein phosphatase 2, regulatory subunit A [Mayamaea pseudoterrestris]|nr:protein phosphatase 2, regulatory subunit A [Mayamaea pseudoterrestris]